MKKIFIIIIVLITFNLFASELHKAIDTENLDQMKSILKTNAELLEEKDDNHLSPLNYAALNNKLDALKVLVEAGGDLYSGDKEGSQALINASAQGHFDVVEYLIKSGADINKQDDNGQTALIFSIIRNKPKVAQFLLSNGAEISIENNFKMRALMYAVMIQNIELTKQLIANGADVNAETTNGVTPLFAASARNSLDIVKLLINNSADVSKLSNNEDNCLSWAIARNQKDNIKYLTEQGLDINRKTSEGRTAAFLALGNLETLKYIENLGADLTIKSNDNTTILMDAIWRANQDVINYLIPKVDLHSINDFGNSAISIAVRTNSVEITKLLLEAGADPSLGCVDGNCNTKTSYPIHFAAQNGNSEIVKMLCETKDVVNIKDIDTKRSALHFAVNKGSIESVQQLLSFNADVNLEDKYGHTPLYYAKKHKFKSIAQLLEDNNAKCIKPKFPKDKKLMKMKDKQAYCWYLGHSGWAVQTQNHILVFDYWLEHLPKAEKSIYNGNIDESFFNDKKVIFLSSHEHRDHFDPRIFEYAKFDNVSFVLGHNAETEIDVNVMQPRQKLLLDEALITSIYSNDTGVGYVVEVDGLTIFHAGDHANRNRDLSGDYLPEIEFINNEIKQIDLAFMPISGCNFGDDEAVRVGVYETLNRLKPKVFIPMHSIHNEIKYETFNDKLSDANYELEKYAPKDIGDWFFYKKGKLRIVN
jgi:ankyrin repeat protein/L-ascorbate metabolism protein UlaG (beta-lactamase superfamily)